MSLTAVARAPIPPTRRIPLATLAVVLASVLLGLTLATTLPLVDPDEGRNAEVAREMAVNGDVVVPHLAGTPYLDKPPALFWGAALAIRAFGPTRWAPRLPAILAAALTLLVLAGLARRIHGEGLAWRSAALLAASPLFAIIGAYVIFDMPLALCVTVVWTLLARELIDGASAPRRALMFAAVALGVLVKGPVMLAWAAGGSAGAAFLLRSREPVRWLAWLPGWGFVAATAGAWFALACVRFPEYPRYAFVEESLERMTRASFDRSQGWWFAPAVLMGGLLPWSLIASWTERWRLRHAAVPPATPGAGAIARRVALGFVLFALVFFTVSRSQLVTYLLPAMPPLALLVASGWTRKIERGSRAWRAAFVAGLAIVPLALLFGGRALHAAAERESTEPLARAIAAEERAAGRALRVRYERCYSAGAEYRLARNHDLVQPKPDQTTSVYQARYHASLKARGLWRGIDDAAAAPPAEILVRPVPDDVALPAGAREIWRGRRLAAFRLAD